MTSLDVIYTCGLAPFDITSLGPICIHMCPCLFLHLNLHPTPPPYLTLQLFVSIQFKYNVTVVDKMDHVTISIDPADVLKKKSSPADCRQIVSDLKHAMEATYKLNVCH